MHSLHKEVVNYNKKPTANFVQASSHKVRILFGQTVVSAERDPDTGFVSIGNMNVYEKDFHGGLNLRAERIHLYMYHAEALLRKHMSSDKLGFFYVLVDSFVKAVFMTEPGSVCEEGRVSRLAVVGR